MLGVVNIVAHAVRIPTVVSKGSAVCGVSDLELILCGQSNALDHVLFYAFSSSVLLELVGLVGSPIADGAGNIVAAFAYGLGIRIGIGIRVSVSLRNIEDLTLGTAAIIPIFAAVAVGSEVDSVLAIFGDSIVIAHAIRVPVGISEA